MDAGWLARLRWRRRGAWLWPTFVALTIVDALVGHLLPSSGDAESIPGAALAGLVANLIAVILLSRPLGAVLRRAKPDLPGVVARNQAGTSVVLALTAVLIGIGIAHHATVVNHERAMAQAIVRAQAWIGAHAPATFARDLRRMDTFAIQPGSLYRSCVPNGPRSRTYCVIVNTNAPFPRGVTFAGYEPNSVFSQGVG